MVCMRISPYSFSCDSSNAAFFTTLQFSEGLKPGMRTDFYERLRSAAGADVDLEDIGWYFPPPAYTENDHLAFTRDPRDADMATHKMILKVKTLLDNFSVLLDEDVLDSAREALGSLLPSIADDNGGYHNFFFKSFSMLLTNQMNEMYIFLEQTGFELPEGGYLHFVGHKKDEKPYIRYKPL